MSTVNFVTMEDFDLYVYDDAKFERYVCPDCGVFPYEEEGRYTCPICECSTEYPEEEGAYLEFSPLDRETWWNNTQEELDTLNDDLRFFELRLVSGYFCDSQIAVLPKTDAEIGDQGFYMGSYRYDATPEYSPHNLDNDDTRYYWDLCRSEAIRKYDAEARKVRRWMGSNLPGMGFDRIVCVGVFSNGEAVYEIA